MNRADQGPAIKLLAEVAGKLAGRGEATEIKVDGIASLYVEYSGRQRLVAYTTPEGKIRVPTPMVWDGHMHVEAGGLPSLHRTPGSPRASAWEIAAEIRERLTALATAHRACSHRPHVDGVCPECGVSLRILAERDGVRGILAATEGRLLADGLRGSLLCDARGGVLRVEWAGEYGSRSDVRDEALRAAADDLRAAGYAATWVPGGGWTQVVPRAADLVERGLDAEASVRDEEPAEDTEVECLDQAAE